MLQNFTANRTTGTGRVVLYILAAAIALFAAPHMRAAD